MIDLQGLDEFEDPGFSFIAGFIIADHVQRIRQMEAGQKRARALKVILGAFRELQNQVGAVQREGLDIAGFNASMLKREQGGDVILRAQRHTARLRQMKLLGMEGTPPEPPAWGEAV